MRVTQLLPSLHAGDAVGDSAFEIHHALQQNGIESVVLGVNIDDNLTDRAVPFDKFPRYDTPDTIHIYHFAVPSPITYAFREAQGRKVIVYHNITPPHFFTRFSEELVTITTTGRHEIKLLADVTDLGLADSEFNRRELVSYGYRKTGVLPILLDFSKYARPAAPHILEQYDDHKVNLLFVGRVTPNKKQEDVIKAFHVYKRYVNPEARLLLVGKYQPQEAYVQYLHDLIADLGVEEVYFSGHVTQQELNAFYTVADALLCMSEHEGFCVPAVESLYFGVPVLAYNCTALPYTLGNAGILINHKRYAEIAEMIDLLIQDTTFRQAILKAQTARLAHFQKENILAALFTHLGLPQTAEVR
ncbi:glycosyltransferase [candidate division KSB3 bacterium]|uniref:Glycosyltransferase n=1 Tax=candidate division KSB3 bacterium TaxID=2044937 RepID=A0A9D5K076_9BACT|nr:glycosyltransferase [candidate division KSB3 bacterium]MBD3327363.1 glycosyltransferase [candidate division KSB3 bacterium]